MLFFVIFLIKNFIFCFIMDEIFDPFVGVPKLTGYYQEGTMFPCGYAGELASKVHKVGMLCLKPIEKGLHFYFKSKHVDLVSQGGVFSQGKKMMYCAAGFACALIGLPLAIVGKGLTLSVSSWKKDFVWEGPKKVEGVRTHRNDFHLLSFNMAGVPDWLAERNYLKPIHERIVHVGQVLEKTCQEQMPDVMCFQEMFDEAASEKLANDLRQRGYTSIIRDVGSSGLYLNSGLFLASKHPLSHVVFYPHPIKTGIEQYANKGLLIATVHVNDKCVIVGNTHLNGGATGGGYLPRAAQLKALHAHMDRYLRERLQEGKAIAGSLLSADTNIAPLDVEHGKVLFEFEWYLQQLIVDPKKAQTYLQVSKLNCTQKAAYESLKMLEAVLPKKEKIMDPAAWEGFFFHVKKIREANFFEVQEDLEAFLTREMPKQQGGPLAVDQWLHDIDSLDTALASSAIDMKSSCVYQKMILEPKRLDYNFTRSKKNLEDEKLFQPAQHLSTQVLATAGLSDHLPVYSHFRL